MDVERMTLVMIPEQQWVEMVTTQQHILQQLKDLAATRSASLSTKFITAKEFMAAVRIGRTKFDQLVQGNKIRIIKKRRKIYVPVSEVERYFTDISIM